MTNEAAADVVLGTGGLGIARYTEDAAPYRDHMAAYRYHFLTHSKPATHLQALTHVREGALRKGMPEVLRRVVEHIKHNLSAKGV